MTNRLQDAVKKITAPPGLADRIQSAIRAAGPPRRHSWTPVYYVAAIAAALVLVVAGTVGYQQGHFRYSDASKQSYISAIASRVDHVIGLGLCDHVQCAVFREYPNDLPTLDELGQTLGPANKDLISAVQGHVPEGYRLVMAHVCQYKGRPFTHLTFRNGKSVLSLMITKRGVGESLGAEQLRATRTASGLDLYVSAVQKYQIAAFETPGHIVYVVSDLAPQQNLQVLADLAPTVRAAIRKGES
jgi:hypothetical protein